MERERETHSSVVASLSLVAPALVTVLGLPFLDEGIPFDVSPLVIGEVSLV